jgi:non-reducing end alpha-L-arabinofuranosidase
VGSGGAPTTGGTSGTTTQPSCTDVSPCGGDVVATWNVTSSCLTVAGDMDVSLASMGCPTVPTTGSLKVTGTWTANSDGTYADNTTTTGTVDFPLAPSCLSISSVAVECSKAADILSAIGWASATCSNASGQCKCTATANQKGGLGVISAYKQTSGTYAISGNTLNTDETVDYAYCVSGSTLTMTPKPSFMGMKGTIVLTKNGTGSGGAGGATTGKGGAGGAGGTTTGKGGAGGTGGASTGSGGKGGTGGASTGTGGAATGGTSTGSGGKGGTGGASTGGSTSTGTGPCDIYAAASMNCVAAHSTVRALLGSYSGALYQVTRSDGQTADIGLLAPGGFADSAAQDTFCSGKTCTITKIYDQSGHGNFVEAETPSSTVGGNSGMTAASATAESLNVGGHKVYSLYTKAAQAYWRDGSKTGMPLGSSPQGIYMVTSGTHVSTGCCYDYGNGETSRTYVAGPSMDSLYFGSCTIWAHGTGSGPWIMADMEDGMVIGNSNTAPISYKFVTAIEKNNGTTQWALRGGDATTGSLTTLYQGALPAGKNPMKKQGSVVLGSGGDCCYSNNNASYGTFYEGAIVAGYPSDSTEEAVQANIVSAGYGK